MKRFIPIIALVALLLPRPAAALSGNELLALVAMPLAVAAVSEVTGVPADDLASFVATLNAADVQPVQFVETLRYVPVALVAEEDGFVTYVRQQNDLGVRGPALITVIEDRLRTYDIDPVVTTTPGQTIWVDSNYIPPVVVTRTAEVKAHPHGGPPGQLKKERGLQTGAEVVHGTKPGNDRKPASTRVVVEHGNSNRAPRVDREPKHKEVHRSPKVEASPRNDDRGRAAKPEKSHGNGNKGGGNKGGGHGNGGGHGKKG